MKPTDDRDAMEPRGSIVRPVEYAIVVPSTPPTVDPFSDLRDQMAVLEEEATQLLQGCKENALIELSPVRRLFRYVTRFRSEARGDAYDMRKKLAAALEKNEMFAKRLAQLEGIVQSAFARAVKGLSANHGAAQAGADKVVRYVEEHAMASRFLDANEVPGATLLARVQWLHDKATKTIVAETEEFFTEVNDSIRVCNAKGEVIDVEPVGAGETTAEIIVSRVEAAAIFSISKR